MHRVTAPLIPAVESSTPTPRVARWSRPAMAVAAAVALLGGCGGGGGDPGDPIVSLTCQPNSRKAALRDYFDDWYFWYAISPRPDPWGGASLDEYFKSLLFTGNATFPADRWSYYENTESFNRFYGDGQSLGYGVAVAGVEVTGRPDLPLYVRHVEPQSPAGLAGVARGDQVLALNGRPVGELIAANDFGVLTADRSGQTLALLLQGASGQRTVTLAAAVYRLSPVPRSAVVNTPGGQPVGYLMVKDMITQALTPATEAFSRFRAAGVRELVVDLRYNGGGLVSVGRDLASLVAGVRAVGATYTSLLYNNRQAAQWNTSYSFTRPADALGLARVYLLVGPRTCSASEQLANGLRPYVDVVMVGDTTCGKPVGFLPKEDTCGTTYNVVNFESVNARNEGRYFDGLQPTCAVAEDWHQPLGAPAEPLLAAALAHADGQGCTGPAAGARTRPLALQRERAQWSEGERPVMIPR
jgi:carboxyl-terminal processing protease